MKLTNDLELNFERHSGGYLNLLTSRGEQRVFNGDYIIDIKDHGRFVVPSVVFDCLSMLSELTMTSNVTRDIVDGANTPEARATDEKEVNNIITEVTEKLAFGHGEVELDEFGLPVK